MSGTKKAVTALMCRIIASTLLYSAGVTVSACFGYNFKLVDVSAFAVTVAALSLAAVVFDQVFRITPESKAVRIMLAIIPPFHSSVPCSLYFRAGGSR